MAVVFGVASGAGPGSGTGNSDTHVTTLNDVVVVITNYDGTFTSISDNATGGSNTYNQIGVEIAGGGMKSRAYWFKAKTSQSISISVVTSAGSFCEIFASEWSGQDVSPIDNSTGTVHAAATANFTDSVTLTNASDGFIAHMSNLSGIASITTAGYTTDSTVDSAILAHETANPGSGLQSVTFSSTNFPTATDCVAWLIGIQAPQGAATPIPPVLMAPYLAA